MAQTSTKKESNETNKAMLDNLQKKNEAKRKRLQNRMDRKLRAVQRKKEKQDEKEALEAQEIMMIQFDKEMAKHHEEARIFFPKEEEWKECINPMNDNLQVSHPSIAALQTAKSSISGTLSKEQCNQSDSDTPDARLAAGTESVTAAEAWMLLNEHISSLRDTNDKIQDNTADSYDSDSTRVAGTKSINNNHPLTGYKKATTTATIFCKAKILINQSENPTSVMVKTLGSY